MSAVNLALNLYAGVALQKNELQEIYQSTIGVHRSKVGYNYPTIRLPHSFSALAGLPNKIYQTVYEGALAFLVVVSPADKASEIPKSSVFTRRYYKFEIRKGKWRRLRP